MILLDRVTKTYPGDEDPALDNISLHIAPHEFVFLVGKSGAGKSTLIKMITKEETPDSGKIIIGGIDLDYVRRRHIPHYRRRLGVVFQDYKLLPTRTVYENVAFALEIAGLSNKEIQKTVPRVLDLVGLLDKSNKFPTHLSGGERQRVSIARSVARQPKILIADEPTGNLDKLTRQEIIDLLQRINDFGTTLLVTTHDENIVNNLSKRVITLKAGRIVDDQKLNGVYRLDSEPEIPIPTLEEQPPIIVRETFYTSTQPTAKQPAAKKSTPASSEKPITKRNTRLASEQNLSLAVEHPSSRKTPKLERDSANQWYAASKPLKAAPKLSNFSAGQTVKLKPAPSLRQAIKTPVKKPSMSLDAAVKAAKAAKAASSTASSTKDKPKTKRVI